MTTAAARLVTLAGTTGTAAALLLLIGNGSTAGAALVNYSGLPSDTAAVHLMTDVATASVTPQVGDGRFWRKGKRPFPRYWWEKDPTKIPDEIPLVDLLEEVEAEELALLEFIDFVGDDHTTNEILRVLRAYAEILHDQAEMKRASIEMQQTIRKANRRKAITLLLH